MASMAARFAAKEALAKALGAPAGMSWHDAEVHRRHGRATVLRDHRHGRRTGLGPLGVAHDPPVACPTTPASPRPWWSARASPCATPTRSPRSVALEAAGDGGGRRRRLDAARRPRPGASGPPSCSPAPRRRLRRPRAGPGRPRQQRRRRPVRRAPAGPPGSCGDRRPLPSGKPHAAGLAALLAAGGRLVAGAAFADHDLTGGCDLVVDGVLGIGGRPGLPDRRRRPGRRLPRTRTIPVVAVDLPSGVDADTGARPERLGPSDQDRHLRRRTSPAT